MCHSCGCRGIPLVKEFIAEHERVTDLAGSALRAPEAGGPGRARDLVGRMAAGLRSHWAGEERGLFAVMRENEEYRGYVDAPAAEYREPAAFLDALDLGSAAEREAFERAVEEPHALIAKEEDGLFPASLTELTGDQRDRAFAA